jgi:predicted transposase YbfD/YdcC
MGCQKKIAQTIRDEKADYILHVKENQGNLGRLHEKRRVSENGDKGNATLWKNRNSKVC